MSDTAKGGPAIESLGLELTPGHEHYRAYVGPPTDYDLVAAMTFSLLVALGCRQQHKVLDIGCGSLRVGRLLIPYLNKRGYAGIEPNEWLVKEGIEREIGEDQVRIKEPRFHFSDNAAALIKDQTEYDFVIAQSIFSHCGIDLLEAWLAQFAQLIADDGTSVVTYLDGPTDTDATGWVYPGCVTFTQRTMERLAREHSLEFVPLLWRHPRQRWALLAKRGFDAARFHDRTLAWDDCLDWISSRGQRPHPSR